ncbi:MAG: M36 family metallopeptidase [Nocardioides sp.]
MTRHPMRRGRLTTLALALLTVTLVPGLTQLPALAAGGTTSATDGPSHRLVTLGDSAPTLRDVDHRGSALPTALQRAAAGSLGAVDLRWNRFGTPSSILPADGSLGAAPGSPVQGARSWLHAHASVFGLSPAQMDALDLVNDQKLAFDGGDAVLFRQRFGSLTPALDSMVTVGVAHGQVAYVSSSLSRTTGTPAAATLTPLQGWLAAAANVGRAVPATARAQITAATSAGWTRLHVPGFAQEQLVRPRSLALADGSVRPVFEANVVDVQGGSAFAYTSMVDARTGDVLQQQSKVDNSTDAFQFNGAYTATDCGPKHPFEITDNKTKQIAVVASAVITSDDIVVKIFDPAGNVLATGDSGTSPEAATYTADAIPAGIYSAQVCPFIGSVNPVTVGGPYAGFVATSDQGAPGTGDATFKPRWRFFPANPRLDWSRSTNGLSNSVVGCWFYGAGCTLSTGPMRNVQAPGPWDTIGTEGISSQTTYGNNANTHEAWLNPLAPGGTAQAPVSATRDYTTPFTDAWNNSGCDPTNLHPGGNDIDAVVTNLFAVHNRMHDFAYYLGFNERNYNLQLDNRGKGGVGGDQETGNAEAGALSGGQPSQLGRDNANQIALQDGVPGITNQYLFQPIAGAFYSPCTDGDLDMSVVGHEYTHAISNRMVGGPDEGLTSDQGGAMGESWSDLDAMEYMYEHHYSTGTSPFVIGAYATGNKVAGIRDYALNKNPLNYSDIAFDGPGEEVHADGEVWNGTQFQVRQALVKKYNAQYPTTNRVLNLKCAQGGPNKGVVRPNQCPGNRRWLQLIFDSFLLQQGSTSMLDARDAMLAADKMRFSGKDLTVMWNAFAKRGMGQGAFSTPDSDQPTPSFASPRSRNGKVTFKAPAPGKLFVGDYEARVTPVADTFAKSKLDNTVSFTPGTYRMVFASTVTGFKRFTLHVKPGQHTTYRVAAPRNLAGHGATLLGSTAGSLNPGALIDGTEATNWGGVTSTNVDVSHPFVSVDLAGGVHTVHRVQVSALLNPAPASATDLPLAVQPDADPDSASRFTALRQFALEACVSGCSSANAHWKRFYVSSKDAFPALVPRPVAPNLTLRSFTVPPTRAAAIRFVVLENQCTGYAGYAGEQDNDPANATDCKTGSDRGTIVHAAELQVY